MESTPSTLALRLRNQMMETGSGLTAGGKTGGALYKATASLDKMRTMISEFNSQLTAYDTEFASKKATQSQDAFRQTQSRLAADLLPRLRHAVDSCKTCDEDLTSLWPKLGLPNKAEDSGLVWFPPGVKTLSADLCNAGLALKMDWRKADCIKSDYAASISPLVSSGQMTKREAKDECDSILSALDSLSPRADDVLRMYVHGHIDTIDTEAAKLSTQVGECDMSIATGVNLLKTSRALVVVLEEWEKVLFFTSA